MTVGMPSRRRAHSVEVVSEYQVLWTWATSGRNSRTLARTLRAAPGFQAETASRAAAAKARSGLGSINLSTAWPPAVASNRASASAIVSSPPRCRYELWICRIRMSYRLRGSRAMAGRGEEPGCYRFCRRWAGGVAGPTPH